ADLTAQARAHPSDCGGSAYANRRDHPSSERTRRVEEGPMARAVSGRGRRWLLLAIGLSLLLRLPFLRLPMISDEGRYAYVAQRWLDGRGHLYDDLWVSRPQGIFAAYGVIQRTIGPSAADLRFGAWLASVVTLVFVWRYAREWAGRGTAAMAAAIFALV